MGFIEQVAAYVQKYAPQYDIKVCSPIIAQAVLESASGTSNKVKVEAEGKTEWRHNYFGLKWRDGRCAISNDYFEEWTAEQKIDGTYENVVSKFCKFKSLEECVIGYFQWTNIPNYANLKFVTDPKTYLENIKKDKYATSINYVENLMKVIEKYNLTQYDSNTGVEETMSKRTVFLSAGHGGSNPGAVAYGLKEKDINLQTLLACKEVLEHHNINVICSRVIDEDDPVQEEVKEANNSGCDLAVSLHVNAGGGNGFEAFCNLKNEGGVTLAKIAEKHIKALGQNSRGIKDGMRLYFVKNTNMTAVLFESFFLDNVNDNKIGDTIEEQRKFGVAYAKAILEYFDIVYKEDSEEKSEKEDPEQTTKLPYMVRVTASALNVRSGAGLQYKIKRDIKKNEVYTIVEEKNGWGKLKSGAGWIRLKYTEKV